MKINKFCWDCGRKINGNHITHRVIDGYIKVLHKNCARELDENGMIEYRLSDWGLHAKDTYYHRKMRGLY